MMRIFLFLLVVVMISGATIVGLPSLKSLLAAAGYQFSDVVFLVTGIFFFGLMVSSIFIFTKPLPVSGRQTSPDGEDLLDSHTVDSFIHLKRSWMILAYTFMIFSLVAAVLPFTLDFRLNPGDPGYNTQVNRILDRPISIFRGCVLGNADAPRSLACYPNEQENDHTLSWVLHIGGHVRVIGPTVTQSEKMPAGQQATSNPDLTGDNDEKQLQYAERTAQPVTTEPARESVTKQPNNNADTAQEIAAEGAGYSVRGGLVVPFYLIILSMFGGAISLTRRIPEYQKQSSSGYVGTKKAPFLTPPMLREYLVFQIVQFISAPFLAMVAYYVVEPGTTPATVALAFAAGFASETVLLWIRGVMDKLEPESGPATQTGSIVGSIPELRNRSIGDLKQALSISVVGHAELPTAFTNHGQFIIEDVPEGPQALEIIRRDASGTNEQTVYRNLTVVANKPAPVLIDFAAP